MKVADNRAVFGAGPPGGTRVAKTEGRGAGCGDDAATRACFDVYRIEADVEQKLMQKKRRESVEIWTRYGGRKVAVADGGAQIDGGGEGDGRGGRALIDAHATSRQQTAISVPSNQFLAVG